MTLGSMLRSFADRMLAPILACAVLSAPLSSASAATWSASAPLSATQIVNGLTTTHAEDPLLGVLQKGTVLPGEVSGAVIFSVDPGAGPLPDTAFLAHLDYTVSGQVWDEDAQQLVPAPDIQGSLEVYWTPDLIPGLSWPDSAAARLDGYHEATLVVDGLWSTLDVQELPAALVVELSLDGERPVALPSSFDPDLLKPKDNATASCPQDITLSWAPLLEASDYDVEWTWVDDYDGVGGYLAATSISFDGDPFADGASRARVRGLSYDIPCVYEHGYLLYRVRAVGSTDDGLAVATTGWAPEAPTNGWSSVGAYPNKVGIPGHDERRNWQASLAFAEEGRLAAGTSYYDGRLQGRQSQARSQTEDQVIVGETIYDMQGRPAVQILPAPSTKSTWLGYLYGYNRSTAGTPYAAEDFDLDNGTCDESAGALSESYGSGLYYSPNNPDQAGAQAYVPDADGYAFRQTRYTRDNTGRVAAEGGVGPTHQLSGGHETRYLYGAATQDRLDRLFGEMDQGGQVGDASHYKLDAVIDGNGGGSVSYKDPAGRVVATALAGKHPEALEKLDSELSTQVVAPLLDANRLDGDALVASQEIAVLTPGEHSFAYAVGGGVYQPDCASGACGEYECVYDLTLRLTDECDQDWMPDIGGDGTYTTVVGDYEAFGTCDGGDDFSESLVTAELPVGTYSLSKTLALDPSALDAYVADYLAHAECALTYEDFLKEELDSLDLSGCGLTCETCNAWLQTWVVPDNVYPGCTGFDSKGQPCLTPKDLAAGEAECEDLCDEGSAACEMYKDSLKQDLWPGNQYGAVDVSKSTYVSGDPLSIFNTTTNRLPVGQSYLNVKAWKSLSLNQIVDAWDDAHAEQALPLHPEYETYAWTCGIESNVNSLDFDSLILNIDEIAVAETKIAALTGKPVDLSATGDPTLSSLVTFDPFFQPGAEGAALKALAQARWDTFACQTSGATTTCLSLPQIAYGIVNCPTSWNCMAAPTITTDDEWMQLRGLYMSIKSGAFLQAQVEAAMAAGSYSGCIGADPNFDPFVYDFASEGQNGYKGFAKSYYYSDDNQACYYVDAGLYADKAPRFPTFQSAALPDAWADPQGALETLASHTSGGGSCAGCPEASALAVFLNTLLAEQTLTGKAVTPSLGPTYALYFDQTASCSGAAQGTGSVSGGSYSFSGGSHDFTLTAPPNWPYDWTEISAVTRVEATGGGDFVVHVEMEDGTEAELVGSSGCVEFDTCGDGETCALTEAGGDLQSVMNALVTDGGLLGTMSLTSAPYDAVAPSGWKSWDGSQLVSTTPHIATITRASGTCQVRFDPAVDWADIVGFSGISPEPGSDVDFTLRATLSDQSLVTLVGHTECGPIAECPDATCEPDPAPELIKNPGFENGNTGFVVEDATHTKFCPGEGQYTVAGLGGPSVGCGSGSCGGDFGDHTTGTGGFLLVGAENTYDGLVRVTWAQTVSGLTAGTIYHASAWVMWAEDLGTEFPVQVELWANGLTIGSTELGKQPGYWRKLEGAWSSDTETSVELQVVLIYPEVEKIFKPEWASIGLDDLSLKDASCDDSALCDVRPFPTVEEVPVCEDQLHALAEHNAKVKYQAYVEALSEQFREQYTAACLGVEETFTDTYEDIQHHYTLFYYDQAGNLVKTVPPEGVDLSGQSVVPAHRMASTYAYNSLNQVVRQDSPDGGETHFVYDRLGRLRFSQNAQQAEDKTTAYTNYDRLGRIVEVGRVEADLWDESKGRPFSWAETVKDLDDQGLSADWAWPKMKRTEVTRTAYDRPLEMKTTGAEDSTDDLFPGQDCNLRGRVVAATVEDVDDGKANTWDRATMYCYDVHGSVKSLVQDLGELEALGQRFHRLAYDYDLVSGNVNEVRYQAGEPDQLTHRYSYDADNRLAEVKSSGDGVYWEREASYSYYQHGPLARAEFGSERVQGVDYVYTLHGWIKGMGPDKLELDRDPGGDGVTGSGVARDEVGFTIGYYPGDYKPISTKAAKFETDKSGLYGTSGANALYNGNIPFMATALRKITTAPGETHLYGYHYDQLNRLVGATTMTPGSSGKGWSTAYSYDANGNFESMDRWSGGTKMDTLSYKYGLNSIGEKEDNRLLYVTDQVPVGDFDNDLDNQGAGNYGYDKTGNLIQDLAEGIDEIGWNLQGKVATVSRESGSTKAELDLAYGPDGERVMKRVRPDGGTADEEDWDTEWTVRDAMGNSLARYKQELGEVCDGDAGASVDVEVQTPSDLSLSYAVNLEIDGVALTGGQVYWQGNDASTAVALAAAINAWVSAPDYTAVAVGPGLTIRSVEVGTSGNGLTAALGAVVGGVGELEVTFAGALKGGKKGENCKERETLTLSEQDRYGSQRLGSWERDVLVAAVTDGVVEEVPGEVVERRRGTRLWELTNHLGNVLGVVTDRLTGAGEAEVWSVADYDPFGMEIAARGFSGVAGYRRGFNGKEKDGELGEAYDYGFRMFDARVGRFLSVDPLARVYPGYSTYSFAGNTPIYAIDYDGLEPEQSTTEQTSTQPLQGTPFKLFMQDFERRKTLSKLILAEIKQDPRTQALLKLDPSLAWEIILDSTYIALDPAEGSGNEAEDSALDAQLENIDGARDLLNTWSERLTGKAWFKLPHEEVREKIEEYFKSPIERAGRHMLLKVVDRKMFTSMMKFVEGVTPAGKVYIFLSEVQLVTPIGEELTPYQVYQQQLATAISLFSHALNEFYTGPPPSLQKVANDRLENTKPVAESTDPHVRIRYEQIVNGRD